MRTAVLLFGLTLLAATGMFWSASETVLQASKAISQHHQQMERTTNAAAPGAP